MVTGVEAVTAKVGHGERQAGGSAGMVTLAGTVAAAVLLLERETMAPPLGAGPLSLTLPVEGDPPLTLVGFSVSEVRVGVTVRKAV